MCNVYVEISTLSLARRLTIIAILESYASFVSTHSLARRLTISDDFNIVIHTVSTHSLARRLTAISNKNVSSEIAYFITIAYTTFSVYHAFNFLHISFP